MIRGMKKSKGNHTTESDRAVGVVYTILMKGDPPCLSNTIRDILDCFLILWHAFES